MARVKVLSPNENDPPAFPPSVADRRPEFLLNRPKPIVASTSPTRPDLDQLVSLFYAEPSELGEFTGLAPADIPEPYRGLLHHDHHMTVNVEAFWQCPVDVQVLSVVRDGRQYSRRILLTRRTDQGVVQFGIVRLNLDVVDPAARAEIEAEQTPLGRVLIEHNVLRHVELHQLYRVLCGRDLAACFQVPPATLTFGRTALIYCNAAPAVELLEIVTPLPATASP